MLKSLFNHSSRRWKVIAKPLNIAEKICNAFPFWKEESASTKDSISKKRISQKRKQHPIKQKVKKDIKVETKRDIEFIEEDEDGSDVITPLVSSMRSSTRSSFGMSLSARESTVNPLAAAMASRKKPARESTVNPLAAAMEAKKRPARESTVNPLAAAMAAKKKACTRKYSQSFSSCYGG